MAHPRVPTTHGEHRPHYASRAATRVACQKNTYRHKTLIPPVPEERLARSPQVPRRTEMISRQRYRCLLFYKELAPHREVRGRCCWCCYCKWEMTKPVVNRLCANEEELYGKPSIIFNALGVAVPSTTPSRTRAFACSAEPALAPSYARVAHRGLHQLIAKDLHHPQLRSGKHEFSGGP